jgi:hypothetical protein
MPARNTHSVFLSHNTADKEFVRRLAAATAVTGAHVWFDEWTIRPGDSIPSAIDQGLAQFSVFALVWSDAASKSQWVRSEMHAALARWMVDQSLRVVPVVIDRTPLPPLLAPLAYVNAMDADHLRAARQLLGIESESAFRLAVQAFIEEAGLEFREFWGVGVMVACPRCGATADNIEGFHDTDHQNDRSYAGARCRLCGWSDASET